MMYAGRAFLTVLALATSSTALPNHLKAVALDVVPVVQGTGVSASFGGYSAKAGLGGTAQGPAGGLYAGADSPLGSAGAGLGGTVAGGQGTSVGNVERPAGTSYGSSSASYAGGAHAEAPPAPSGGHKPSHHQGPTGFDSIFNIPISVLQAVNTYLNNRGPVTKPVGHRRRAHRPGRRGNQEDEDVVYKTVSPVRGEASGIDAGAAIEGTYTADAAAPAAGPSAIPAAGPPAIPAAGAPAPGTQGYAVVHKRVNYDDIFNIPITALKSVSDLLNG